MMYLYWLPCLLCLTSLTFLVLPSPFKWTTYILILVSGYFGGNPNGAISIPHYVSYGVLQQTSGESTSDIQFQERKPSFRNLGKKWGVFFFCYKNSSGRLLLEWIQLLSDPIKELHPFYPSSLLSLAFILNLFAHIKKYLLHLKNHSHIPVRRKENV